MSRKRQCELERERRAAAKRRLHLDLATHLLDDFLADGQSKTCTAELAIDRLVHLCENF